MTTILPTATTSPLRQRLIEEMNLRRFARETKRNYIRELRCSTTFLGRPPDSVTRSRLFESNTEDGSSARS